MRIESTASILPVADEPVDPKGAPPNGGGAFAAIIDQFRTATASVPAESSDIMVSQDPAVPEAVSGLAGSYQEAAPADRVLATSQADPSARGGDSEDTPPDQPGTPSTAANANLAGFPVIQIKRAADALPGASAAQPVASSPDNTVTRSDALAVREALSGAASFISRTRPPLKGNPTLPGGFVRTADTAASSGAPHVEEADTLVRTVRVSDQASPWRRIHTGSETNDLAVPDSGGPVRERDQGGFTARMSGREAVSPDVPRGRPANELSIPLLLVAENEGQGEEDIRPAASTGDAVSVFKPGTQLAPAKGLQEPAAPEGAPSHASGYLPADGGAIPVRSVDPSQNALTGSRPGAAAEETARYHSVNVPQPGTGVVLGQAPMGERDHLTLPGESAPTTDTAVSDRVPPVVEADTPVRAVRASDQAAPWRHVPAGSEMNVAGVPAAGVPAREGDQGSIAARMFGGEAGSPELRGDGPAKELAAPSLRVAENEGRRSEGVRPAAFTGDAVSASKPGTLLTQTTGPQGTAAPDGAHSSASGNPSTDGEAVQVRSDVSARGAPIGRQPKPESDGFRAHIVNKAQASEPSVPFSLAHKAADMPTSVPSPSSDAVLIRSALLFEVAERITMAARGSMREVTIQLKPDHLGRISLTAQSVADGLIARITTESASVKQFLESSLPALQQSLQEQGLKVHHIDVLTQQRSDLQNPGSLGQQRPGHAHQEQESPGQTGIAETALGQASSAASELLVDPWTLAALYPHSTFHTVV